MVVSMTQRHRTQRRARSWVTLSLQRVAVLSWALVICALVICNANFSFAEREPCLLLKTSRKPMQAAGVAKVAVIIVDLPGVPTTYTPEDVVRGLRERQPGSPFSAFDVFSQSSRGEFRVDFGVKPNGQSAVFGPYLVDRRSSTSCTKGYRAWSTQAADLAAVDGYKRKRYQHTVYLLPPRSTIGCGVTGIGEVGGDTTWLFGLSANSFTHELGHNLGLFHSGRRDSTGIAAQYGDHSSPMGSFQPETVLFSAPHRSQLGWVPSTEGETIAAGAAVTRTLFALERQRDTTRARVISIPLADGSSYKLSYRQELPEAPSSRSRRYVTGITIHRDFGMGFTTKLMGVLSDGKSFIDERNNIKITQSHHSADSVTIDLSGASAANPYEKGCYLVDLCSVTSEGRTPSAMDCRGYVASVSPYQFSSGARCPTRAPGEDNDLDGIADTDVQTADADGDGVPNEEDCAPTSSDLYRLFRSTDVDGDGAYETIVPNSQGICGSSTNPPNYLDEAPLDSCPSINDPSQADNDRNGIGDVCESNDPLAASRRRILPALRQLSRAAVTLRKAPSEDAQELAKATSYALKLFLSNFSAEAALSASTKSALAKAAKQLAKSGAEKSEAKALSKILAPLE